MLCCAKPSNIERQTIVLHTEGAWRLPEPEQPEVLLAQWISAYHYGLTRPLPLFAKTGRAYAAAAIKDPDELHKAATAARALWFSGFRNAGEGEKHSNRYVYRSHLPIEDEDFRYWSTLLLGPMLENAQDVKIEELGGLS